MSRVHVKCVAAFIGTMAVLISINVRAFTQDAREVPAEPGEVSGTEQTAEESTAENGFEETRAPNVELFGQEGKTTEDKGNAEAAPSVDAPDTKEGEQSTKQPDYWKELLKGLDAESATVGEMGTAPSQAGGESETSVAPGVSYAKALSTLCLVLAGILIALYAVRRMGKGTRLFAASNLATLLGRVYLDPRSSLHFVRVGRKILVVGVTRNGIAPVAELDDDLLEPGFPVEKPSEVATPRSSRFAAYLRERTARMTDRNAERQAARKTPRGGEHDDVPDMVRDDEFDDSEIMSLRDDIQRLQRTLREPSSETDSE